MNLADGHLDDVWEVVEQRAVPHLLVTEAVVPGPIGECWANAWRYAKRNLDRYQYIEGLVTSSVGLLPWVRPNVDYPHAWVFDKETDSAIECTEKWSTLPARYRGVAVPERMARIVFEDIYKILPPSSVLEALTVLRVFEKTAR